MKSTELAWAAGLFDGEGCIHINRQRTTTRPDIRTDTFRLYVQIGMGDNRTLKRFKSIIGIGTIHPNIPSNKRANPAWCWMSSAHNAKAVLLKLLPYLYTKKNEAVMALRFIRLPNALIGGRGGNKPVPKKLFKRRLRYYWKLRMMKSRWRFYKEKLTKGEKHEIMKLGLK